MSLTAAESIFHKVISTGKLEVIFLVRELAYIDFLLVKGKKISVLASRILPFEYYSPQNYAMATITRSEDEIEVLLPSVNKLSSILLRIERTT